MQSSDLAGVIMIGMVLATVCWIAFTLLIYNLKSERIQQEKHLAAIDKGYEFRIIKGNKEITLGTEWVKSDKD